MRKSRSWRAGGIGGLALVLALAACASRPPSRRPAAAPSLPPSSGALLVRLPGGVRAVPLEDYVAGCVAAELGSIPLDAGSAARARDVQAILCRSFAVTDRGRHADEGFDLCATNHCQMFSPAPDTAIGRLARAAAARTAGLVLFAGDVPLRPYYHADCGGRTSAVEDVFGGPPQPALVSLRDETCTRRPAWHLTLPLDRLQRILRDDPRTAVAGRLDAIEVASRDGAGRAATLRLAGHPARVVRGTDVRGVLLAALGPQSLRSTLFDIAMHDRLVTFTGRGSGHGVGLCQAGAIARAARGDTPAAILAHYFPGAHVGPVA